MIWEPPIVWLIVGALFLGIEAFGVPGIGFLFAGLAAILVGVLTQYGIIGIDDWVVQGAAFFALTGLFAVLLWKKLKQWRTSPGSAGDYKNMIGDLATVGKGGLSKGTIGQVSWSGTTMMAELADGADACAQGAMVEIVAVKGNRLVVKPV